MTPTERELLDYFEGRGRFAERADFLGMEASNTPRLFAQYFATLGPEARREMAATIASIALGQEPAHPDHVANATRLLVDLAIRGFAADLATLRPELETELADPDRLARWSASPDGLPPPEDLAYRDDWHYALQLWGVLYLLGSPRADVAYTYLTQHAQSGRFREALRNARALYDQKRAS
jgi:hypothetical protein